MAEHTTPQEGLHAEKVQLGVGIVAGNNVVWRIVQQIERLKLKGEAALDQESRAEAVSQLGKALSTHSGSTRGKQRTGRL